MFNNIATQNLSDNKALFQFNLNHKTTGNEQVEEDECIEFYITPHTFKATNLNYELAEIDSSYKV